jgi:superfamily I DNA and RNA helicase
MQFNWADSGDTTIAEKEIWNALLLALDDEKGVCFHRFPILSADRTKREPDILILYKQWGLYVLNCLNYKIENMSSLEDGRWKLVNWSSSEENPITQTEDQLLAVLDKFRNESSLRQGRKDLIQGHIVLALPFISHSDWKSKNLTVPENAILLFGEDLEPMRFKEKLQNLPADEQQGYLADEQWELALSVLQGGPVLRRPLRPEPSNHSSKAFMLREVERQMMSIDREQSKVAIQVPDGPQRIRGLSGSGKTVVMCMKAAWMHLRFPDWDIVYTFYTRSLYGMIKSLIGRFYRYYADEDPDWNKIHVLHGWGGKNTAGLYGYIASSVGLSPKTYTEAKYSFGFIEQNSNLLGKCCQELLTLVPKLPQLFDAILIDEGQDFDFNFYKLCYQVLRMPKRLVWAYDEVQSLESLKIPTASDIFGQSEDGSPLVDLQGTYPGDVEKDIVLYRCYRTPRPVLVVAHLFGMGLLRQQGAVQFIPKRGGWEDIGYEILDGSFTPGTPLTIRRPQANSPHILEKLVGYKDLVVYKNFSDREAEFTWVADQIVSNIKNDELRPEEILVISLDYSANKTIMPLLKFKLSERNIQSITPGYDTPSDVFQLKDFVTVTNIYPAKGNEASIVYCICFEHVGMNPRLIVQERNQAFTAMTRTRGWCVLTGVGTEAEILFREIEKILKDPEKVTFLVPDPRLIQRNLDSLEYERRRNRVKKATELANQLKQILTEINDPNLRKDLLDKIGK